MPKFENIGDWVEKRFGGQRQAAKALGVTQGAISDWINGKRVPKPDKQAKMVKFDYDGPFPEAKKKGGINRDELVGLQAQVKVLREGQSVKTEEFGEDGDVILDLDVGGNLLGIEILSVTRETSNLMREIAEQFDVPQLLRHFHPENLGQVFA